MTTLNKHFKRKITILGGKGRSSRTFKQKLQKEEATQRDKEEATQRLVEGARKLLVKEAHREK